MSARGLIIAAVALLGCEPPCEPAPEGSLGSPTSWEEAFLEERGIPTPPPRAGLQAEDGLTLSYLDWIPTGWDGTGPVLLLIHGSSAHGALYGVLGQGLADRGVLTRTPDLRGHGLSRCAPPERCGEDAGSFDYEGEAYWVGRPGDSADSNQIIRDVAAHLADLRQRWPDAPLLLAGHSSGGGVVSRYVEHGGMAQLAGAALLAPFNHHQQPQNDLGSWECGRVVGTPYAQVDVGALGDAERGDVHRYVLSFHKEDVYTDPLDTLEYTYTTMRGMAVENLDSFHSAYVAPTLWIAAEEDALLNLSVSSSELQRMPGAQAFVIVEDTSHVGLSWSDGVASLLADFAWAPDAVSSGEIRP